MVYRYNDQSIGVGNLPNCKKKCLYIGHGWCIRIEEDKRGGFDTRPNSVWQVTICFMCEEETWLTCNIQNEILVPWWDCEVTSIQPDDSHKNSICVWLKHEEYIKKNYPQHVIPYEESEDKE